MSTEHGFRPAFGSGMEEELTVYYGEPMVSIIIPVRNQAEHIRPLAKELEEALRDRLWTWECIWVDDDSEDQSLSILRELSQQRAHHRGISLDKPAGPSAALWAGFTASKGSILATVDCDGRSDPDNLPQLVDMVRSGLTDMVNGFRIKRGRSYPSNQAYRLLDAFRSLFIGRTVKDPSCSLRALRRECMERLPLFSGMHRFLPTLVFIQGFRLMEAPVSFRPRKKAKSKRAGGNRLRAGLVDLLGVLWLRKRGGRFLSKQSADRQDARADWSSIRF